MPKHAYVAVQYYEHIAPQTEHALFAEIGDISSAGWLMSVQRIGSFSDLCRARNLVISSFLASECSDLVLIDGDVAWEDKALLRLLSWPVDCVLGLYRGRLDPESYPVRWLPDPQNRGLWAVDPVTGQPNEKGLIEIDGAGTGFMRLSRTCVERMVKGYPDRWYHDELAPKGKALDLFEFTVEDHTRWSEDLMFCRMWRAIGGRVWADPWLKFAHVGPKEFTGCVGEWLRGRPQEERVAAA